MCPRRSLTSHLHMRLAITLAHRYVCWLSLPASLVQLVQAKPIERQSLAGSCKENWGQSDPPAKVARAAACCKGKRGLGTGRSKLSQRVLLVCPREVEDIVQGSSRFCLFQAVAFWRFCFLLDGKRITLFILCHSSLLLKPTHLCYVLAPGYVNKDRALFSRTLPVLVVAK